MRIKEFFIADARESPGAVYRVQGREHVFHRRGAGNVYSIAFTQDGSLYFVNANDTKIFQVDSSRERVVHTHDTYVRDIAFDQNDTLYFSEATGAGGDGRIYSMQRGNPSLFAEIRLDDIGGYWSGDFAFDTHHNLYISTGNRIPASIYRRNRGWEEIHREESDALSEGDPNYDAVCDYRDTLDGWPSISEFAYMFRTYGGFCWGGRCTCMCKAQLFATLLCRVGIPRDRITVAGAHYN